MAGGGLLVVLQRCRAPGPRAGGRAGEFRQCLAMGGGHRRARTFLADAVELRERRLAVAEATSGHVIGGKSQRAGDQARGEGSVLGGLGRILDGDNSF